MKRIFGVVILLFILFAIYTDLAVGTLPETMVQIQLKSQETGSLIRFVEVRVEHGDTLISLIEKQGGFPGHISITRMIDDFPS